MVQVCNSEWATSIASWTQCHTRSEVRNTNLVASRCWLAIVETNLHCLHGHFQNVVPAKLTKHTYIAIVIIMHMRLFTHILEKEKLVVAYFPFIYWVVLPSSSYSSPVPLHLYIIVVSPLMQILKHVTHTYEDTSPTNTTNFITAGITSADPSGSTDVYIHTYIHTYIFCINDLVA